MNFQLYVLTGPESSGKTTLANVLAKQFNASLVEEYARTFLSNSKGVYTKDDVIKMAQHQLKLEQAAIKKTKQLLFLDTDLITYKIWLSVKYNITLDWIEKEIATYGNKHYFLCANDFPWEADDLREHPKPEDRKMLFDAYLNVLKNNHLPFTILSGSLKNRIEKSEVLILNR